jgi:putative transposase
MNILRHTIKLKPTDEQIDFLIRACGVNRFTYNWALGESIKRYENTKKSVSMMALKKEFNRIKLTEFPWVYDSPKDANQQPFADVQNCLKRFFTKQSEFPRFKSKHDSRQSFYLSGDKFKVLDMFVQIPKLGYIEMTEGLRFSGNILSARVISEADKWYLSICIKGDFRKTRVSDNEVGVDLGVATTVTLSDGTKSNAPRGLKRYLRRLKIHQRKLSKKTRGSSNHNKQKLKVRKLHAKIANQRKDYWHKLTTKLCRENQTIVIEDLDIRSMIRSSPKKSAFRRAIIDTSMGAFRPMLSYKAELYGCTLIVADKWFPSSKLCSDCGYKMPKMELSLRTWTCPNCSEIHDRDINAAINLRNYRQA